MGTIARLSVIALLAAAYYLAISWLEPRLPYARLPPFWLDMFPRPTGATLWFALMDLCAAIAAAIPVAILTAFCVTRPKLAALSISAIAAAIAVAGAVGYLGAAPHTAPISLRILSVLFSAIAILCAVPLLTAVALCLRSNFRWSGP